MYQYNDISSHFQYFFYWTESNNRQCCNIHVNYRRIYMRKLLLSAIYTDTCIDICSENGYKKQVYVKIYTKLEDD